MMRTVLRLPILMARFAGKAGAIIVSNFILRQDSGYVLREDGSKFIREQ
jgi:hypothetical protein